MSAVQEGGPSIPIDPHCDPSDPCIYNLKVVVKFEFDATNSYLEKLKEKSTYNDKKNAINDFKAIKQEMEEIAKRNKHGMVQEDMIDNMMFRISNRLRDFCLEEDLSDEYCSKLKDIFDVERQALEETLMEANKKCNILQRKMIADDVNLIKGYLNKYAQPKGIVLPEQKWNNAATRIGKFICDVNYLSIAYSKTLPFVPDDDTPPS